MNSFNEVSAHLIGFAENEVSALVGGRCSNCKDALYNYSHEYLHEYVQETNLIRNNAWRLTCSHLEQPLVERF